MENKVKNVDSKKHKNKEMKVGEVTKMKVGEALMKSDENQKAEGEAKALDIKVKKKEVCFDFNIKKIIDDFQIIRQ